VFPVALPAAIHAAYSKPGQLVYDPFCGAGTSLLAAEQGGRVCYGMELSEAYCEAAVERWHRVREKPAPNPVRRRKRQPAPPTQGTLFPP
jgi:DNA modification methylase